MEPNTNQKILQNQTGLWCQEIATSGNNDMQACVYTNEAMEQSREHGGEGWAKARPYEHYSEEGALVVAELEDAGSAVRWANLEFGGELIKLHRRSLVEFVWMFTLTGPLDPLK